MSTRAHASLDARLSAALRPLATDAPMPPGVLDVPDEWVAPRPRLRRAREGALIAGVIATAAAGTLILVTVLGSLGRAPSVGEHPQPSTATLPEIGVPIENLDTTFRSSQPLPDGPDMPVPGGGIEVARGEVDGQSFSYAVSADSETGICIHEQSTMGGGQACGALPGEGLMGERFGMGMNTLGSNVPHGAVGVVAVDVPQVWVETDTGGRATAILVDLRPADLEASLFIAMLPGGSDATAWVAADADGTVLERADLGRPPDPTEGPMPTPAGG